MRAHNRNLAFYSGATTVATHNATSNESTSDVTPTGSESEPASHGRDPDTNTSLFITSCSNNCASASLPQMVES